MLTRMTCSDPENNNNEVYDDKLQEQSKTFWENEYFYF